MLDIKTYAIWLDDFTKKHPFFRNNDWWHDDYSIKDKTNINNIRDFFKIIDNYAHRNSISPIADDCGYHYYIKHNNIGYSIGIGHTTNSYCFCERRKIPQNASFIMIDKLICDDLITLSETVEKLLAANIPIETIVETFNNTLEKHKKKA